MAFCTAHGEEAVSFQLVNLTSHQVQHMRTDAMHLAAVPLRYGISFQRVIVFMVAADEGKREGQAFQPIQRFIVAAVTKPHAAAVSCNDDRVILRHVSLFREVFRLETPEVSVTVTSHINHANFLLLGWSTACSISTPLRKVTLIRLPARTVTFSSI